MKRRIALGAAAAVPLAGLFGVREAHAASDALLVGQSAPLSGPVGAQLQAVAGGARIAFDKVNRAGGVHGRKLELLSLDDKLQPALSRDNCDNLVTQHRAIALFGIAGSANAVAAEPVLRATGVPMVGGIAISDSARAITADCAYYVRAGYEREAETIVRQLALIGISQVGIVHFANAGGGEIKSVLHRLMEAKGIATVSTQAVAQDGSNLGACIAEMARARPGAVILFIAGALVPRFIGGMVDAGVFSSYYGLSLVPAEMSAAQLGTKLRSLVISQVMPYPWNQADPVLNEYRKLADAAQQPIGYPGFEGYVGGLVLVEALQRAGREVTHARLHGALRSLRGHVGGLDLDFTGGKHTGSGFVELVHITGSGRFSR